MITSKRINTIIIEDEPPAIDLLENVLKSVPEINNLQSFNGADAALDFLALSPEVDMIFLDVEMPGKNGFDFLKELIKFPISPSIVFTTGFSKYAIDAIKAAAFDYLLKPVSADDIRDTIRRYKICNAQDDIKSKYQKLLNRVDAGKILKFKNLHGVVLVHCEDIVYVESNGNYSFVYQLGCKKELVTMQLVTMQLGAIEKILPENHFFRISRKIIINLRFLIKVNTKAKCCVLKCEYNEIELSGSARQLKKIVETI